MDQGSHGHHAAPRPPAGSGTARCRAGDVGGRRVSDAALPHRLRDRCEVLGMVVGTAAGLHNAARVVLSVGLAFVFGYGLTMRGVLRAGVDVRTALKIALAADTVSIAVMELLGNTGIVAVPGAMDAGPTSVLFWASLAGSLVVAFLLATPINRWMISRGRGHAVVHAYHHAH